MSILEELWRGRLAPGNQRVEEGSNFDKLQSELRQEEEKFRDSLTPDAQAAYDALCEKQTFLSNLSEQENFIVGFRLAFLLGLEAVSGDNAKFLRD